MTRVPYLRPVDDPQLVELATRHALELKREGYGTCLNCGEAIVRAYTSGQNEELMPFHPADDGPWTWHANGRMCRDADRQAEPTDRYRYHRCDHQEAMADVR